MFEGGEIYFLVSPFDFIGRFFIFGLRMESSELYVKKLLKLFLWFQWDFYFGHDSGSSRFELTINKFLSIRGF